jgi:phosphatidate cytidylyltransferase
MISENLKSRIITASIMLPLFLLVLYWGGAIFNTICAVALVIGASEWYNIITVKKRNKHLIRWLILGGVVLTLPIGLLMIIRSESNGFINCLYIFLVVWTTDISAFFVGKKIGGPKLAPTISPKKTISGLVGAIFACYLLGFGLKYIPSFLHISNQLALFSASLVLVSQAGDLFESWVKRCYNVKDSGSILPGHGGLLDRIDGLLFVIPTYYVYQNFL